MPCMYDDSSLSPKPNIMPTNFYVVVVVVALFQMIACVCYMQKQIATKRIEILLLFVYSIV